MSSVQDDITARQQAFTDKLGKDFHDKRRADDMRRMFEAILHRTYPTVPIVWLRGKHSALAKILFTHYDPDLLLQMLERYATTREYHRERGISFEGFYALHAKLATDLAAAEQKTAVVAQRRTAIAEADAAAEASMLEQFQQSAFFKRMPRLFQEKLSGKSDKSET